MNKEYPKPLAFDPRSSDNDTRDACEKYKIKKSNLNADLFEVLLRRTDINPALQASLVRGWREGLNLGSKLPETDHLVECPRMQKEQKDVLRSSIEKEAKLGRLSGPWAKPLKDGRWFKNAWVSPYFVIPKKTAPGAPTRWRLIHHLSFHKSGLRKLSLNGRIDMNEFPICFPTHMTGAHLIFCKSPTGSAVFSRDIRDFYRNFLLNPYSWWQTYSKALGSYWFNPYMPFGGSSCTSLAQRQSDAVISIAKVTVPQEGSNNRVKEYLPVERVGAKLVAMLDDFLAVVPRKPSDSDEQLLKWAESCTVRFDDLLHKPGLPKAAEKDQDPGFSVVWFGVGSALSPQHSACPRRIGRINYFM